MTELLAPEAVETLMAQVRARAERAAELRAVGSRTSKSDCFETRGEALSLRHFTSLRRLDGDRVRAGAGVVLRDLIAFLRTERLALPTLGEWSGQTVAGAASTGTHGGSYVHGSLCASVQRVVWVDGHGALRTLRRGEAGFDHVLPSFGTTGVIVEVDLQCEPTFGLAMTRRCVPLEQALEELWGTDRVEYRSAIWLPTTGHVLDYCADRVPALPPRYRRRRTPRFSTPAMALDTLTRALHRPAASPTWARAAMPRLFPDRYAIGPYDELLTPLKGDAAAILAKRARNRTPPEGEFAVTADGAISLVRELLALFRRLGRSADRPVGLRPGAREAGTLAATGRGTSLWVSLFVEPRSPLMEYLPGLVREHAARPHWGKAIFHRPEDVAPLYPGWQQFDAFRHGLDPQGIFLNDFARRYGLGRSSVTR